MTENKNEKNIEIPSSSGRREIVGETSVASTAALAVGWLGAQKGISGASWA